MVMNRSHVTCRASHSNNEMFHTGSEEVDRFFREQLTLPENDRCCDTNSSSPRWASVSHGIYISIEAAGIHRSLGVSTSFVLSMSLDRWKPAQLKMMELGGNQRFQKFMSEQGVPEDLPIREKYSTRAAAWYRINLIALAEGSTPPEPLPAGVGNLPLQPNPDPTMAVLDRIFASAQYGRDVEEESILAAFALQSRAEELRRKENCQCECGCVPRWLSEMGQVLVDSLLQPHGEEQAPLRLQDHRSESVEMTETDRSPEATLASASQQSVPEIQQQQELAVR